jgi:hypothetical protein
VTVHDDLLAAIAAMPVSDETVPPGIDSFWVEISRLCLVGWANEIDRDAARIASSLQIARVAGATPTAEQIASLEEAFWRVRSATEKVDAVIALGYGPTGLRLYDARRKGLRFEPDSDENSQLLKDIGTETALSLRSARAALEGERATLRRHQLMHSVVPIAKLHDLAPYIVVHHRDGRVIPGGFELSRLAPERWAEGVSTAAAADLFKRRLHEAERSLQQLEALLAALAKSLAVDARVEVPQRVYLEEDKRTITFELPKSTAPVPRVEVEFVVDGDPSVPARVFSTQRKMHAGEELRLEDAVWRVIRVEDTNDGHIDQIAYCRRTPYSDT